MNYPHYPEFSGLKYKVGDRVQIFDADGNLHPGEIIEIMPSGRYRVQSGKHKVAVTKDQIFPAPSNTVFAEPEASKQKEEQSSQALGKHLKSGGKAYYYHPGEKEPIPVHDVWLGKEENLPQFIDFDAVNSGTARIERDVEQPPKEKAPKLRGLTKSEVAVYLRSGSEFSYLDNDVKATKHDGGHSLNDMMADRSLATDENVDAWFSHQMEREKSRSQASVPKPTSNASVSQPQGQPEYFTDAQGVNWTIEPDGQMHGTPPGRNGHQHQSGEPSQSTSSKVLDAAQVGLDAAGVADPTPIADGTNAVISLVRAGMEPDRAGEHVKNAAISAISAIPYVGDIVKAAKYGGKATRSSSKAAKATDDAAAIGNAAEFIDNAAGSSNQSWLSSTMDWLSEFSSKRSKRSNSHSNASASASSGGGSSNATGNAGGGGGAGGNNAGGGGGGQAGGGAGGGGNNPATDVSPPPGGSSNNAPVLNVDKLIDEVVETAGVIGTLGKKAYDFADRMDMVNRQMIEYNRGLSKFSGELSAAYGKLDSDRMLRDIKAAGTQSESLAGLIGAQSKLEEALQELKGDWRIVGNDIQQVLTNISTSIIEIIDFVSPIEELWPALRKKLVAWHILDKQQGNGQFGGFPKELEEIRKRIADMEKNERKID